MLINHGPETDIVMIQSILQNVAMILEIAVQRKPVILSGKHIAKNVYVNNYKRKEINHNSLVIYTDYLLLLYFLNYLF